MIKTSNFTTNENIDLSKEISLVAPTDTPFYTFLLGKNLWDETGSKIATWREKTLDSTENVSVPEGSDLTNIVASSRAEKNNICEIFMKGVEVSGSAEASTITGIPSLLNSEIQDRLIEMKINVEKKLISGTRNDGSATPFVRKMDGLMAFALTDNTVSNASLTEVKFKETVKKLWTNGLGGDFIGMMNADLKETIDGIYDGKYSYIAQESLFGLVTRTIQTNYGNVTLVLNRHMPVDKIAIFDPAYFRVTYLRKPFFETLAKTGDSVKGQVITECTLKCMNQKALAVFSKTA